MLESIIKILKQKSTLGEKVFSKHFPNEYKIIKEYTDKFNIVDWSECKYFYINQLHETPKCKICGNSVKFYKSANHYKETCCRECDRKLKSLSHQKIWNNYTDEEKINRLNHASQIKEERYGYSSPFASSEVKQKIKESNLKKYGVDNYFKSSQFKQYMENNFYNNKEYIQKKTDKAIQTCNIKYNANSFTQTKEGKQKIKESNIKKYGIDNYAKMVNYDKLESEYLFGLSKMDILQKCLISDFPGTPKWEKDNPIWDCYIYGSISPKEAWGKEEYLIRAIDNLFSITIKSIEEDKYLDFVNRIRKAFYKNDNSLLVEVLNRFTIAKIAPKVTALQPSAFLRIIKEANIDISSGIYCPMAGFGGIVEGAKRYFKENNISAEIEAFDINPNLCNYYGWKQKDVLSDYVNTDKVVFVCPPFGEKTERWLGTPDNMYYNFEEWVSLIKEHIKAKDYIFVGPETNSNTNRTGLFRKKFGIAYYPKYSNK